MTYTVYDPDGAPLAYGLSAVDAAHRILGYQGRHYELRRTEDSWRLYITIRSLRADRRNAGIVETNIYSLAETEAEAWGEIAEQVMAEDWPGYPFAAPGPGPTYTVIQPNGSPIARGLSAVDAVHEILGYQGRDYELRRTEVGWQLYVSRKLSRVLNGGGMVYTDIYSIAGTEAEAWEEIARQVMAADWPEYPRAVPDEEYLEYRRATQCGGCAAAGDQTS